ncbi:MAG TPA: inositol monophosphatase family protein [Bacteroidia bacterium]|nr:inositol monophosphatase family protein [Bacteroidia bacterium]
MNLEVLCGKVCEVAKAAGDFIQAESKKISSADVEMKGHNNLVSYVDKKAEELIVSSLEKISPGSGFITEEKTVSETQKEITWIIDPLDGTTNFIHKVPCYCVSIGMMVDGKLSLGVIYEPNLDEMFFGYAGGEARMNKQIIKVSPTPLLANALLATGFPYHDYNLMEPYIEVFKSLMKDSRGLRRLGSAAVDLAYVACGRFDGFYEYGLNSWDVAAGAFLVELAGGKVSGFSGDENFLFGKEIVATNGKIHDELLNLIQKTFSKKKE